MTSLRYRRVADKCDKAWQQTKSKNTRAAILEAALSLFHDLSLNIVEQNVC